MSLSPRPVWFCILIPNADADQVLLARQRDGIEQVKLAHTLADLTRFPREKSSRSEATVDILTTSMTIPSSVKLKRAVSSGHFRMTAYNNAATQKRGVEIHSGS